MTEGWLHVQLMSTGADQVIQLNRNTFVNVCRMNAQDSLVMRLSFSISELGTFAFHQYEHRKNTDAVPYSNIAALSPRYKLQEATLEL